MRNRREWETERKSLGKREGTHDCRCNYDIHPCKCKCAGCRRASGRDARIRRIDFQTKNGFPAAPAGRARFWIIVIAATRCAHVVERAVQTVTPVFKESRRFRTALTSDATLCVDLVPPVPHIPIIRRNLTWIVESCVKPLKKYIRVDGWKWVVREIIARVGSSHEEHSGSEFTRLYEISWDTHSEKNIMHYV